VVEERSIWCGMLESSCGMLAPPDAWSVLVGLQLITVQGNEWKNCHGLLAVYSVCYHLLRRLNVKVYLVPVLAV